jgi:phosphoribosylformylglycinamidine (FGAM) synthase-like amidotransferase family enzyme
MTTSVLRPKALVLKGDALSCDAETAHAFATAGFEVHLRHINDLVQEKISESELFPTYQCIALPSGASYTDCFGLGKALALRIKYELGWQLTPFAQKGGLVIGIGSGFHALIRLGVFGKDLSMTSAPNGKVFQSWLKVTPVGQTCVWLKGLGLMDLPVRTTEGRLVIHPNRKTEVLVKMQRKGLNCLRFESNPLQSEESIAGLCDVTGRILGLIPHPESFIRWTSHPEWTMSPQRAHAPGPGLSVFENAYQEALRAITPPA